MWNADWMEHKPESRLQGEVSIIPDMQMTPHLWQSKEELKSFFVKVKKESEKACLKLSIQEINITSSGPITS